MIIFWGCFHTIMWIVLAVICMFTEVTGAGKEVCNNEKYANDKKAYYFGEKIMLMIIMLAVGVTILVIVLYIIMKNQTVAVWFWGIFGIAYVYMAVKQTIKMIFIPEKRAFSYSDINDFMYTYMFWWIMVLVVGSIAFGGGKSDKILLTYGEIVKIGSLLFWYYFNILYAFGGLYIFLYYLWKTGKKVTTKFNFRGKKIKIIINEICDLWERGERYDGLRSFRLWKQNNGKPVVYKLFMSIPLLIVDVGRVIYLFVKYFVRVTFLFIAALICDPFRVLYKCVKNLWNRHKNNEWMYLFAQIAGLFSYAIVFLIIQYAEYEEVTKKIYEFVGTIVLVPYFISKIVNVNKNPKGDKSKVNIEGEKEPALPKNMVYNEDGEGIIDGKTIRQLEYEVMQNAVKNPEFTKKDDDIKLWKESQRIAREGFRKKVKEFIKNNIEILVGICILILLVCIYYIFKGSNAEHNISMIGSIIGAEGAILSVLISIAFMKKSNEKALDASVLPYLTVEKEKKPDENAYAFEYIKDVDEKRNFSIWRVFDFNTICDNKVKLVRNGVVYLHIKNIGIGPALSLKMKIKNFSSIFLPIDYLRPDDEFYLILNFNNPDRSCQTDIIFEYETIRGERHVQKFHANITWHLDRTNFTLFR